jgi:hypothetical protein
MAEVGFLIVFVLLLLVAVTAMRLDKQSRSMRGKEPVATETLAELNAAKSALQAIAQALGVPPGAPPQEIQRLVRVVEESARTSQAQSDLQAAKGMLAEIRRAQDKLTKIAARASENEAQAVSDQLTQQSYEIANKEGQLQYLEKRLAALGQGKGERPCWVEPDGSIEFLYDVVLTSAGIRMKPRADLEQKWKFADVSLPAIDPAEVLTESEFLSRTRSIYEYGKRDENQCRFYVFVYDGTEPTAKRLYKQLLKTVEGHFYKQYTVPDGIPF